MARLYDYVDIVKAFGKQDYVIYKKDYLDHIRKSPLVNGLWTVGNWFSFVANTHSWSLEFVAGDSVGITGYTHKEIIRNNEQFVSNFIFKEDFPFVTSVIGLAMNYVNELPMDERPYVYVVFYNRTPHRDGKTLVVQNQNIPLVFDEKNIPFVFANIITDVTHLRPANIPYAIVLNKTSGQRFHLDTKNMQLKPFHSRFTPREREVIDLLVNGCSSRKVAESLQISYETARTHRKNILKKAGAKNTSQLLSSVLLHNDW